MKDLGKEILHILCGIDKSHETFEICGMPFVVRSYIAKNVKHYELVNESQGFRTTLYLNNVCGMYPLILMRVVLLDKLACIKTLDVLDLDLSGGRVFVDTYCSLLCDLTVERFKQKFWE